jgi:asparagine synthase (glutamine-hydrolysing)
VSGIVGILHLDGEPVDRALLERMTEFMTFRGPDAQEIWVEGAVGFGHTMLRTTWEAEYEQQPFTLDRQVWVVADARVDDRDTLAQKLEIALLPTPPFCGNEGVVTDVELILRAYLKWGEDCVEHLLGDFAFAIWDGRRQRLFCARDQFGVKLFYYSRVGNCLIFSNTLNCIRQHPKVSSELNEAAIGDFLLFGINYNIETTTFADIQRMPGAHTLTCSIEQGVEMRRYWTLPMPELIRYKNSQDYIDRFKELMGQAVGDRLRQERVAIYLSGGLDSTTIAATALEIATQKSQPLDLQAFTVVYDRLIPDDERYYAEIAAKALAIPIHFHLADNYQLYDGWERPELKFPQPRNEPFASIAVDQSQQITAHSRVALHGEGGDEALKGRTVLGLSRCMSTVELIWDIKRCLFEHHLSPNWGSGVLAQMRRWRGKQTNTTTDYPVWLNQNFADRQHLFNRWQQIEKAQLNYSNTPRAEAHFSLDSHLFKVLWSYIFENYDASFSKTLLEVRLPFLDLRLLFYLLALPPLPWCVGKTLTRLAMRTYLPGVICQRPKTTQAINPLNLRLRQELPLPLKFADASIEAFIDREALMQSDESTCRPRWSSAAGLRAIVLGYWFNQLPQ